MLERLGLMALRRLDPERAHDLALAALARGLVPMPGARDRPRLRTRLAGLDLPNPLGLAAGFDKNARALPALARAGFGFLEVGAATPRPQAGNPRPRLFRLAADRAVINRFGFNNDGAAAIAARLAARPPGAIIGLNLGANKDSADRPGDFAAVLAACGAHLDFATVNVSSPNTERLRDLQGPAALRAVLARVLAARDRLPRAIPVFVKIAPDLGAGELEDLAGVCLESGIDGIVATNTTLARDGLREPAAREAGGLSGAPLFGRSTRVLARLHRLTEGRLPLIGVGGVDGPEAAWAKIRAGATAVQLYTALTDQGFALVPRILDGIEARLAAGGFESVAAAVGTGRDDWL